MRAELWTPTCVRALVDLEVFAASEHLPAAGEGTRERLLARVHADVVDEFVLRLEGSSVARTGLPEARVVRLFRAPDVFHRDVRHDLVHRREGLSAAGRLLRSLLLRPQTRVLLLDRRSDVAEEGAAMWRHVAHVAHVAHRRVHVVEVVVRGDGSGVEVFAARVLNRAELFPGGAAIRLPGQSEPHLSGPARRRRLVQSREEGVRRRHRLGVVRPRVVAAARRHVHARLAGVGHRHVVPPEEEVARAVPADVRVTVAVRLPHVLAGVGVLRAQLQRPRRQMGALHERVEHRAAVSPPLSYHLRGPASRM